MKKLLQINSVVKFGSTGRIAEQIGEIAMSRGYESYIAYGRKKASSKSNLIKIENKFGNFLHLLKTRLTDRHGLGSTLATKKFIEKIKKIKPDIIHLHNLHGYYLNYKILFDYLNTSQIPLIWTLHDCWSFTGHCSYFDYANCNKWISGCYSCPQLNSYPVSFVDNSKNNYEIKASLFDKNTDLTIIPVSNWLNELLKKSFLNKHRSIVIHNGIDLNNFQPLINYDIVDKKYGLKNKSIILGVASVWEKRKGLEDFIKLSYKLKKDEIIVLVGLNKKQLKALPDNIIGLQRTNSIKELAQLYSRASVFFNPTYEDNFPTTNLEAMACGTPVITYDTGGSSESINEETGYVIPKGNLELAMNHIREIIVSNKNTQLNSCVKNVKNNFEMNSQFQKYFDIYDSVIAKKDNFNV